jgi:serine/threonine protein kinase
MKIVSKKYFHKNPGETNHMINELEALKLLHHPNIVHLREVIDDHDEQDLYMIMQYLPG